MMNNDNFIPLLPGSQKRRAVMLSTLIPGVILVLSTISPGSSTVGSALLKLFNIVVGLLVIFASVKEYKKPGSTKYFGADVLTVLTGFLIIAQASSAYKPERGFQPAHLLFLAAAISIFKGVMIPEGKIKRGCVFTENSIEIKTSFFRTYKFEVSEITSLNLNDNVITISGENIGSKKIDLKNFTNADEIYNALLNKISGNKNPEAE